MAIGAEYWLDIIRREYLQEFVSHVGAAVKFLVPGDDLDGDQLKLTIHRNLLETSAADNFLFLSVDSKSTKIHLIDKLFNEVARQVDWENLAYLFLQKLLTAEGYKVPSSRSDFDLRRIAELNEIAEKLVRLEIRKLLTKSLFRDFEMSQEFRLAMMRLCLAELDPEDDKYLVESIKEWLRGELRLISTLKPAGIFQKVARHNARHMLFSLAHWIRLNGINGMILCLDISRYLMTARNRLEDGLYYSAPATLDAYELLRQFIDGTDELEGCFVVIIASHEFLTDERRGLNRYDALKLRIWDEVHDKNRENPLSSLIRVS
jgi:hypothetical protein